MKVILKRNWNAPDDQLFFVRNNPVEVDDSLLPHLPSDAVIVGKTRDQTRKEVLVARREGGHDRPTAELPTVGLRSDEDLLAELDGKVKPAKTPNPGGTGTEKVPEPPTKKQLEANLKTAEANLENAQKKLANAKTEPDKGVAKADLDLAENGVNEAKGALLAFEDED